MNHVVVLQNELENLLNYLKNKTDDVKKAIEGFSAEKVKSVDGMII